MTQKELSKLYYLNQEIETDTYRLSELREYATGNTSMITGMPHIGCIPNKTAIAAEIADAESILEAKHKLCIAEYNRLNRFIASIDDVLIQRIVTLRFIKGYSWTKVAKEIGGNTPDSVRMALKRYLDATE